MVVHYYDPAGPSIQRDHSQRTDGGRLVRDISTMLPKSGDLNNPGNWRPIAVLPICYKLFARIVYNRLRLFLDPQISDEQMGFMPNRGTDDALLTLESVTQNSIDYQIPLWFASLDLHKAFDRIEWMQLFA